MARSPAPAAATTSDPIPFLDLRATHRALEAELVEAFRRALLAGAFVGGTEVEGFEREFAHYCGARWSVAVNSGTDALRFAFIALGLKPGDEVITAAHTFIATSEAITQAGGKVRFADVDPRTRTIDPQAVADAITPRTVGILPVHLYGQPADLDPLLELATRHGLWLVEDAAQAHGSRYKGKPVGTFGQMSCFSFYPGKNLGSLGEGGALTGMNDSVVPALRQQREHGQSQKYIHESEGYNGRMHAIQAAFLRIKLRHLEEWTEARRRVAGWYRDALAGVEGIELPVEASYARHVYHLYVIQVEARDRLRDRLTARGIGTGLHYPVPLHLQRAYAHLGLPPGSFPVTERSAATCLSLPMFPELTQAQVGRVADAVRHALKG
jgi:dTDP-4-amino-4,6-dideoxygalactose transaminase